MSVRCIDAVFRSWYPRGGNHLLVLIAMADFARDDGTEIRPSIATLAAKVRCGKRQLQYTLRDLCREGVVEPVSGTTGGARGSVTVYRLRLDRLTGAADCTGAANCTGALHCADGCTPLRGRVHSTAPNPSLTVLNRKEDAPAAPSRLTPIKPAANPSARPGPSLPATTETRPLPPATANSAREIAWGLGVRLLTTAGLSEPKARAFLGRMAKRDEKKLAEVIAGIAMRPVADPRSYIAKVMQPRRREFVG